MNSPRDAYREERAAKRRDNRARRRRQRFLDAMEARLKLIAEIEYSRLMEAITRAD